MRLIKKLQAIRKSKNDFYDEPGELASLVEKTINDLTTGSAPFNQYIRHRYRRPFEYSVYWSIRYSIAFTVLTTFVIAGGLASSVLASSGNGNSALVSGIGLLVAISAAVNRLWRPGVRAALRHQAANALRRHGWSFVCGRKPYDIAYDKSIDLFLLEIERINRGVESIDEHQPDESGEEPVNRVPATS